MTKIFDTSTLKGLKAAERFQNRMYNLYDSVQVYSLGLNRVQIVALKPISKSDELDLGSHLSDVTKWL